MFRRMLQLKSRGAMGMTPNFNDQKPPGNPTKCLVIVACSQDIGISLAKQTWTLQTQRQHTKNISNNKPNERRFATKFSGNLFKDDIEPLSDVGPLNMFSKKIWWLCVAWNFLPSENHPCPRCQSFNKKSLHDSIFEFEFLGFALFWWKKSTPKIHSPRWRSIEFGVKAKCPANFCPRVLGGFKSWLNFCKTFCMPGLQKQQDIQFQQISGFFNPWLTFKNYTDKFSMGSLKNGMLFHEKLKNKAKKERILHHRLITIYWLFL